MKLRIDSPRPDFIKEMAEVAGLFFYPLTLAEDEADLRVLHTEERMDGLRRCDIRLSGCLEGNYQNSETPQKDPLTEKRLHKRQVKLVLYHALKLATGKHPAWGSLTGIRPTRLIYEALSEGLSINRACGRMMDVFDVRYLKTPGC